MADRSILWRTAMRSERYEDAWAIARATLAERDPRTRDDPALPYHLRWVWDGSDVAGRDVLVRCYHGLGDTIQFARFLPMLAARARSVTVEIQPRLIDLVATVDSRISFIPFDPAQPAPRGDLDVEIGELDLVLSAPPTAAPGAYVRAQPAILPRGTIALCYGAGDWDRDRSVPAHLYAPFCRYAPCVTLMAEPTTLGVLNPKGCRFDVGVTAGLIAGASLVITVDTMIAHLAGALGKPTWLLLKAEPDWRWAPDRTTSPWYPSMRLYVQSQPGCWDAVIARVARDLAHRVAAQGVGR